jgi:cobaltochelatase CobN
MSTPRRPRLAFVLQPSVCDALVEGLDLFRAEHGDWFEVAVHPTHDIEEERVPAAAVRESLRAADVVVCGFYAGGRTAALVRSATADTTQAVALLYGGGPEILSLLRLGSLSLRGMMNKKPGPPDAKPKKPKPPNLRFIARAMRWVERLGSVLPVGKLRHARNWVRITRYWGEGGPENVRDLLLFLGREYAGLSLPRPPKPRVYPQSGVYNPFTGDRHTTTAEYRRAVRWDDAEPTVGVVIYNGSHFAQSAVPAKALAEHLRDRHGFNALPVFASPDEVLPAICRYFLPGGQPAVDAVVYLRWFRLTQFGAGGGGDGLAVLRDLGVPVFNGAPLYGREVEQWKAATEGFSPVETLTAVILPELDGIVEPLPLAGLAKVPSAAAGGMIETVVPIPDRVERMASRIAAWCRLRRLANPDKRVAFVLYNNPPGEDNLGNAAYLDTFESLRRILLAMRERGYAVEDIPDPKGFPARLIERGLVNAARWGREEAAMAEAPTVTAADYRGWLGKLPAAGELADHWGKAPGSVMVHGGRFLLPVVEFGNVLVGLQPSRGWEADPDKIAHDKTLPPHHQYAAFYRWLEETWKPDAVVHVGTHGTLEFLKGKEAGMSETCWPLSLLGNVPHLYLYHVVNASEAVIAKRRTLGTLVNYNSPAFTSSGLYDEYARLEDLLAEHAEARTLNPGRAEHLGKAVREAAAALNFTQESLEELHEELARMKRSIIPRGLHVVGEDVNAEGRREFATFLMRYDRGEVASGHRLLAEARGEVYEDLLRDPVRPGPDGKPVNVLEAVEQEARGLAVKALEHGRLPAEPRLRAAVEFAVRAAGQLGGAGELASLFAGLDGRRVEPALGGDPIRNPEVLPTGRNSYQFDPALVPSDEAVRRGREIAENTLAHYRRVHGTYPKTTAVILWGFETTKTRGETVGQVLAYLGVRVVPTGNPWDKKVVPIPLTELGRPRVDCHVQICGFFRDMFPNVVALLNRAAEVVAALDEPDGQNFVRENTLALEAKLKGTVPEGKLKAVTTGRVYGPRPGEYGTRTTHLIETGAWKSEEEIARVFADSMSHLYGDNVRGERIREAYDDRLGRVELVSQVRDCHEYEVMDLDHYYEFFGGLSRTVEAARGTPPEMIISDTSKEVIRTEGVGEAINRGVRTRLLNPKWIDDLLRHDYHGVQKVGERVENLIGFAATTHAVENWVWSAVTDRYVRDEEMFRRLIENNQYATEEMLNRLMEARDRGYWAATEEELDLLRGRYLQLEGHIEEGVES